MEEGRMARSRFRSFSNIRVGEGRDRVILSSQEMEVLNG